MWLKVKHVRRDGENIELVIQDNAVSTVAQGKDESLVKPCSDFLVCLCSIARMHVHRHSVQLLQRGKCPQQEYNDTSSFNSFDCSGKQIWSKGFEILEKIIYW